MLGLAHGIMIKYSADKAMVFELEQQDHQDDPESDIDGEVFDFGLPVTHTLLSKDYSNKNKLSNTTHLTLGVQLLGVSQPTPPPEYLG
ncbi:hypothetical protein [Maribacter luteus]|uniref:hypothetical protein n=1 Tax=Maribacter luteus TaxID=2594478 RepID=UPI0024904B3F|nr:hypothetical protein [Maribacter luteus]